MKRFVLCIAALSASAVPAGAQDAPPPRVMATVRAALAPALPFPDTDATGAVPANDSTSALWMVRPPADGERTFEVIANPLNEVNQLRAARAMAQIEANIQSAQRRAEIQYEGAVAEAKRTGKSQDVDGVTLSDEGVAGAKIDAESHVLIDVYFNQPAYAFPIASSVEPAVSRPLTISGASVIAVPAHIYRDERPGERYAEAQTIIFLGRVNTPDVHKRARNSFEVTASTGSGDNLLTSSMVMHLRGNEVLIADVLRKTNWESLQELLK